MICGSTPAASTFSPLHGSACCFGEAPHRQEAKGKQRIGWVCHRAINQHLNDDHDDAQQDNPACPPRYRINSICVYHSTSDHSILATQSSAHHGVIQQLDADERRIGAVLGSQAGHECDRLLRVRGAGLRQIVPPDLVHLQRRAVLVPAMRHGSSDTCVSACCAAGSGYHTLFWPTNSTIRSAQHVQ